MAFAPQALIRGIVSKLLPQANADSANQDASNRLWTYGENTVISMVRKTHVLADEGSYFLVGNNQTGIVPTYGTAFAAANPFILVQNQTLKSLYLDYLALVAMAAGASTTLAGYTACAVVIDNTLRFSSGGTNLTPNIVSPNMAIGAPNGVQIYCGAITAAAASAQARTLVGIRNLRPALSATVVNVIGDTNVFNFGGVEAAMNGSISITAGVSNIIPIPLPPVVIGQNCSALFYLWYPVMSAPSAATYAPELGFWLR